jgi:hypothetical protein
MRFEKRTPSESKPLQTLRGIAVFISTLWIAAIPEVWITGSYSVFPLVVGIVLILIGSSYILYQLSKFWYSPLFIDAKTKKLFFLVHGWPMFSVLNFFRVCGPGMGANYVETIVLNLAFIAVNILLISLMVLDYKRLKREIAAGRKP